MTANCFYCDHQIYDPRGHNIHPSNVLYRKNEKHSCGKTYFYFVLMKQTLYVLT